MPRVSHPDVLYAQALEPESILRPLLGGSRLKPLLYHYTSASAALDILRSGELWASSYAQLNDPLEIRGYLGAIWSKQVNEAIEALDTAQFGERGAVARAIREDVLRKPPRSWSPSSLSACICSLSEVADSLPQWRQYGDDAHGVAVGIDPRNLILPAKALIGPVSYETAEVGLKLRELVARAMDAVCRQNSLGTTARNAFVLSVTRSMFYLSAFYKDPSYRHEGEWRVVIPCVDVEFARAQRDENFRDHLFDELRESGLRARVRGRRLVAYIPIPIRHKTSPKLALKSLSVGPSQTDPAVLSVLWLSAVENGWPSNVQIDRVSLPYRS